MRESFIIFLRTQMSINCARKYLFSFEFSIRALIIRALTFHNFYQLVRALAR